MGACKAFTQKLLNYNEIWYVNNWRPRTHTSYLYMPIYLMLVIIIINVTKNAISIKYIVYFLIHIPNELINNCLSSQTKQKGPYFTLTSNTTSLVERIINQ